MTDVQKVITATQTVYHAIVMCWVLYQTVTARKGGFYTKPRYSDFWGEPCCCNFVADNSASLFERSKYSNAIGHLVNWSYPFLARIIGYCTTL